MSVNREIIQIRKERDDARAEAAKIRSELDESNRLLRIATGLLRDLHKGSAAVARFLAGES